MKNEKFKIIQYNGKDTNYFISDKGRVYSNISGKFLKPRLTQQKYGYYFVTINDGDNHKEVCVHKLVAKYFIPNDRALSEIDHIDGNRFNNSADNLQWCTHKENMNNIHTRIKRSKTMKQKRWMYKGDEVRRVDQDLVDMFILNGYQFGKKASMSN